MDPVKHIGVSQSLSSHDILGFGMGYPCRHAQAQHAVDLALKDLRMPLLQKVRELAVDYGDTVEVEVTVKAVSRDVARSEKEKLADLERFFDKLAVYDFSLYHKAIEESHRRRELQGGGPI